MPMGSPSMLQPNGTDIAGEPVRSKGIAARNALRGGTLWPLTSSSVELWGWATTALEETMKQFVEQIEPLLTQADRLRMQARLALRKGA